MRSGSHKQTNSQRQLRNYAARQAPPSIFEMFTCLLCGFRLSFDFEQLGCLNQFINYVVFDIINRGKDN